MLSKILNEKSIVYFAIPGGVTGASAHAIVAGAHPDIAKSLPSFAPLSLATMNDNNYRCVATAHSQ